MIVRLGHLTAVGANYVLVESGVTSLISESGLATTSSIAQVINSGIDSEQ